MKREPTKRQLVKGYLSINAVQLKDIVDFSGAKYKTVNNVLNGYGKSDKVRKAVIELIRRSRPADAEKIEEIWPEGEQLAA
ncbi:MAG: hypothetical protein OEV42_19475 [Deltaproteobacteria bacterium]|nr:hypothetical protein [Deltaproteobacteria bacterium]